jgi:selenocysteine-specific elongation factor
MDELLAAVAAFSQARAPQAGRDPGELASGSAGPVPQAVPFPLERLLKTGKLAADQELLRLPDHKVSMASDQARLFDTLKKIYDDGGLTPPNLKDVLESLDLTFKEAQPVYKTAHGPGTRGPDQGRHVLLGRGLCGTGGQGGGVFRDGKGDGPVELQGYRRLSRKFAIPYLGIHGQGKDHRAGGR